MCATFITSERVLLNFKGAQESIPPGYTGWRVGTTTRLIAPVDCSKIPALKALVLVWASAVVEINYTYVYPFSYHSE
jgi:hypothetical protein